MKTTIAQAISSGLVIHKLVDGNPYREGTGRHARFEAYREGKTVAAVLEDKRVKRTGFRWDVNTKMIAIVAPGKKVTPAKTAATKPAKKAAK